MTGDNMIEQSAERVLLQALANEQQVSNVLRQQLIEAYERIAELTPDEEGEDT